MNSPYYDPKIFLLDHDLDKELIQQTLELLEFVLGEHPMSVERDVYVEQMFYDALNKYKDSENLSIDAVKRKIEEQGYSYLVDIFDVTEDSLRTLAAYLPLIQLLKATRPGLELIFTILNIDFQITEWWQKPSELELLSYVLTVELINQPLSTTIIPRMKKFSREYVYPLLTSISIAIAYKLNKTPRVAAVAYSKTALTVWQEFLWLIWSGDADPDQFWTDQRPFQDPPSHKSFWQGTANTELEWGSKDAVGDVDNTWSSKIDPSDIRIWKALPPEGISDGDLLEWWIGRTSLFGKPEESWCTEDKNEEDPILTYWSGDESSDIDGTLVQFVIIANPSSAQVEINGEKVSSVTVRRGTKVEYRVYDPSGDYISQSGTRVPLDNMVLTVTLVKLAPKRTFTLQATPASAKVALSYIDISMIDINSIESSLGIVQKTVDQGTVLYWKVALDGYREQFGSVVVNEDIVKSINLEAIPRYTFKINATPADAVVKINDEERTSYTDYENTLISWSVSSPDYIGQSGSYTLVADRTIDVDLEKSTHVITVNYSPVIAATVNCVTVSGKLISNTRPTDTSSATITAERGSVIKCTITPKSQTDYLATSTTFTFDTDKIISVDLTPVPQYTFTINPDPATAIVKLNGSAQKSITVKSGTSVAWSVEADGYTAQSGTHIVTADLTKNVTLELVPVPKFKCYAGSFDGGAIYNYVAPDAKAGSQVYCLSKWAMISALALEPAANSSQLAPGRTPVNGYVDIATTIYQIDETSMSAQGGSATSTRYTLPRYAAGDLWT